MGARAVTTPNLVGSMLPRLFTPPLAAGRGKLCPCGCALSPATSLGFSFIEFVTEVIKAPLYPWQRWLSIHAFETIERDGKRVFRFRTVLVLVARQNGKTTFAELKNLWKMYVLQVPLVIGTAQSVDLAEESWVKGVEIAEAVPELAEMIVAVDKTNGKKALRLNNSSRWLVKAATRGGGRGLSGDDVNLDELREHRKFEAWGAISKTTMARPGSQVWAITNAGDDGSVVLNKLQEDAREVIKELSAGNVDPRHVSTGLFEWTVPDDVKCTCMRTGARPHKPTCQLADRALWAQANPALGHGLLTEIAIIDALGTDPEGVFRTEVLCQRVPDLNRAVIDAIAWSNLADRDSRPNLDNVTFAVDVSPDGDASIASYSETDGVGHLELVDHRPGTSWIPERLATLKARYNPVAIVLDAHGPAGQLLVALDELGIRKQKIDVDQQTLAESWRRGGLFVPATQEVAAACAQFVAAVRDGEFRHIDQEPMTVAISGAKARPLGDSWAWGRRLADVDISPLVACTHARYAHVKLSPKLAVEQDYNVLNSVY